MKQQYPFYHSDRLAKHCLYTARLDKASICWAYRYRILAAIGAIATLIAGAPAFGSSPSTTMAPPTSIFFDDEVSKVSNAIDDNTPSGQFVGTINAADGDGPFTYTLVAGEGDTDNFRFEIDGNSLYTADFIDFETHPDPISIRVQADNGVDAPYVQALVLSINDLTEGAFGSAGNEFLVNDPPSTSAQTNSAIAHDANGNFVVVWQDQNDGIFAQRYDAANNPVGDVLRVDNPDNDDQILPDVAMADDGSFVVVWQGGNQDGNGTAVIGRLYSNAGVPGDEFVVNDVEEGNQGNPNVAMNASGVFVVVWEGNGGADVDGVYRRLYAADGTSQGGQSPVNTTIANVQSEASVGIDDNGNFVVTWVSQNQVDASSLGDIYLQRYDNTAAKVGGEILVNTTTVNDQTLPDVAVRGGGAFVIVWQSNLQDGSEGGIYLQAYDNAGAVVGGETAVNTQTNGNQFAPSVSMNNNGDFAVAYTGVNDGSLTNREIRVRRFTGGTAGDDFEVNKIRTGLQRYPDIAINENGGFVISWESSFAGSGDYDIYAQRFYNNTAPTEIALDNTNIADGSAAGALVGNFTTTDADAGDQFGYALVAGDGSTDNAAFTIQNGQLLTAAAVDMATQASYSVRVRSTDALGATFEKAFTITVVEAGAMPVVATNAGVSVAQGDTVTISQQALEVTDADNTPDQLTYTLTVLPVNGTLQKSDAALEANGTFTQQEINDGVITYVHDNSATTADSLKFTVSDGQGGTIAATNFAITVTTGDNQVPVVATNAGISAPQGDTVTVSQNVLEVTDAESAPEVVTYTLVTIPANGGLQKSEVTLAVGETFTQADINNGLITYVHNGGDATSDGFSFTAADEAGGTTEETQVAITITAAGTPTANAGQDQVVTDENGDGVEDVALDGSASVDSDGTIASYVWRENDADIATGATATVSLAVGTHTIALVVTDDAGLTASDTVVVTVNASGDNQAPTVATNAGLSLEQQGDTVAITPAELEATDAESGPEALTYTLTQVPVNGTLQRDGADLAVDGTFTQQDINDGLIRYVNNGALEESDSLRFTVADANGGVTAETQFGIAINVVVTAVGDEIDNNVVVVYPNPSQQMLFVKMDEATYGQVQIRISNSMGQLFKSVQRNARELAKYPIDISNLSRGTYFVRIENGNQTVIRKLIKE